MFDGEDAHPFLHVRQGFHVRHVGTGGVGVGGVDQGEHVGVIVRRVPDFADEVIPAVPRQFLDASGSRVVVEGAPRVVTETLPVVVKFEPGLQLVQAAVRVVGELLPDNVAVRHLAVLHQCAAAASVHVHSDVPAVIPRQPELAHHPVTGLFPQDGVVVEGAVSRRVDFIEGRGSQKLVIVRHGAVVVTGIADWGIELLVIRAAGVMRVHVVDHPITAHERAVDWFVAQIRQTRPAIDGRLRQPEVIGAETAGLNWIAEGDQALAVRPVVIERGGELGDSRKIVGRLNVEGGDRAGRIGGNRCAINSIAGNGVAAGAVVHHGRRCVSGSGINAILELQ